MQRKPSVRIVAAVWLMITQSARRTAAFALIATLVLGLVAAALLNFYGRMAATAEGAVPVRISMSGFDPAEIQARVGEPLTIELINLDNSLHTDGGGWHNFVIEELGVNVKVAPESRVVFTITPTEAGEYDFYCDMCCGGKANPYMHGRLLVS